LLSTCIPLRRRDTPPNFAWAFPNRPCWTGSFAFLLCLAGLLLLTYLSSHAQQRYSVNGTIRDKTTGEVLIGATVSFLEVPRSGITSNSYGFLFHNRPAGELYDDRQLHGVRIGYLKIDLNHNTLLPVELSTGNTQLTEVVISARKRNDNITKPLMGVQKLTTNEIQNIPVLFGEKDVLKTIQLLRAFNLPETATAVFLYGAGAPTRT